MPLTYALYCMETRTETAIVAPWISGYFANFIGMNCVNFLYIAIDVDEWNQQSKMSENIVCKKIAWEFFLVKFLQRVKFYKNKVIFLS